MKLSNLLLKKNFKITTSLRLLSSSSNIILTDNYNNNNSVRRIILNNPKKRNALSLEMLEKLNEQFNIIEKQCNDDTNDNNDKQQQSIRALIISSNCDKIFSSGHDLKEMSNNGRNYCARIFDECSRLMLRIRDLPIPVICQVDGLAAAAGCQFVASCDIVVATKRSKFSTPGSNVGLFCSTPGIAISHTMNKRMASFMLLTGLSINSNDALMSGLVTMLSEDVDEMNVQTTKILESILMKPMNIIAIGKKFMYKQMMMNDLYEAYRQGSTIMLENLSMPECQEGIDAFINKRKPNWK